jgi:cyclic pyranopterin phosphate synthase
LTYEELLSLISLSNSLGVQKVRLTGGEPFVRKDFTHFLQRLRAEQPNCDIRLTTNGTLLADKVPKLHEAGLEVVNISLDTLNRTKYQSITGRDYFGEVRRAIDVCLSWGIRVKINVVALKGVNDSEVEDFVQLALENPLDVRFIEFMPIGEKSIWKEDRYWPISEILESAQRVTSLTQIEDKKKDSGPAKMYDLPEGKGRLGFISPLSAHFCHQCNRLRITSDGRLRTCLFSDKEYRLRPILRSPKLGLPAVLRVIKLANQAKPLGYHLLEKHKKEMVCQRGMSTIGG